MGNLKLNKKEPAEPETTDLSCFEKSNIKIYSTQTCPYCVRAKSYLSKNGFDYEEIDLTNKFSEIDEIKKKTDHMTVPLIFVDDKFIGGYTDMISKIETGALNLKK